MKTSCIRYATLKEINLRWPNLKSISNLNKWSCSSGTIVQVTLTFYDSSDEFRLNIDKIWTQYVNRKYGQLPPEEFITWFKPRLYKFITTNSDDSWNWAYVDGEPLQLDLPFCSTT
jgi:hypothetical protein